MTVGNFEQAEATENAKKVYENYITEVIGLNNSASEVRY